MSAARLWSPGLSFDTPGDLVADCAGSVGTCHRAGDLATASFVLQANSYSFTTAAGGARITGLPYPAKGPAGAEWYGTLTCQGVATPAGAKLESRIQAGSSVLTIAASGPARSLANVAAADLPPPGPILLRGTIAYGIAPWDASPARVAWLGDSITGRWPLASYRAGALNAGVSGNTTAQMRARLQADVLAAAPALVAVLGGTNDLYQDESAFGAGERPIDDLRAIALACIAAGARVVLGTLPPIDWAATNAPTQGGIALYQGRLLNLNDELRQLARELGVALAEYHGVLLLADGTQDKRLFVDSTHPNELGYDVMWALLAPLLA